VCVGECLVLLGAVRQGGVVRLVRPLMPVAPGLGGATAPTCGHLQLSLCLRPDPGGGPKTSSSYGTARVSATLLPAPPATASLLDPWPHIGAHAAHQLAAASPLVAAHLGQQVAPQVAQVLQHTPRLDLAWSPPSWQAVGTGCERIGVGEEERRRGEEGEGEEGSVGGRGGEEGESASSGGGRDNGGEAAPEPLEDANESDDDMHHKGVLSPEP
jgi:hypothetical protein